MSYAHRGLAEKRYLMTPGPTPVPPQVLAAMALPIVHHRSPDFKPTYKQCLERLKEIFPSGVCDYGQPDAGRP